MEKWGKAYWQDLAERVASTGVYGLITLFTLDATGNYSLSRLWLVVVLPMILSALKGLMANLPDTTGGSASLVGVKSVSKNQGGYAYDGGPLILVLAIVGIVLLVLLFAHVI